MIHLLLKPFPAIVLACGHLLHRLLNDNIFLILLFLGIFLIMLFLAVHLSLQVRSHFILPLKPAPSSLLLLQKVEVGVVSLHLVPNGHRFPESTTTVSAWYFLCVLRLRDKLVFIGCCQDCRRKRAVSLRYLQGKLLLSVSRVGCGNSSFHVIKGALFFRGPRALIRRIPSF